MYFYYVYNPKRSKPTKMHLTETEAVAEAARLASMKNNYGEDFYVLKATHHVTTPINPPIIKDLR